MIASLLLLAAPFCPQVIHARTPAGPARPGLAQPYLPSGPYGADTFGYTDPHPPEFHPLGDDQFTAVRLEEVVLITNSSQDMTQVRRDDVLAGGGASGRMPGLPSLSDVDGAAMGDLRGDGRRLIVTVGFINAQGPRRLRVLEQDSAGRYNEIRNERLPTYRDIDIECADVDGDGRDEIVCAVFESNSSRRHEVWIVDDLLDGPWATASTMPLLDRRVLGTGGTSEVAKVNIAELDGDAAPEIFVTVSEGNSRVDCYAMDDLQANLGEIASGSVSMSYPAEFMRATSVDSDGDGVDELAIAGRDILKVVRIAGTSFSSVGSISLGSPGMSPSVATQPVGWDRNGSGREEIAFMRITRTDVGTPWSPAEADTVEIESWARQGSSSWSMTVSDVVLQPSFGGLAQTVRVVDLVGLEDDNDGRNELRGAVAMEGAGGSDLWEFRVDGDEVRDLDDRSLVGGGEDLFLVAGDDDGETIEVRWTGRKELNVTAPLPIVVMEAVPTKAGAQQNYGLSGSTFSSGSSTSTSYATTSALSIGMTGGFSVPNLFGLLDLEAKSTITGTVATTTGTTEIVRTFTTYGSSHDVHSIVFQGTLQHSYLYEVLRAADPAAIGSIMALNVPVATNEWKWTLDAYNAAFLNQRIDPAVVFAHSGGSTVIGDPTSYPSRSELEGYVTGATPLHTGWVGGSSTVGEGFAFNGFGLSLGSIATTSSERTLSIEVGVTFEAAGTILGASAGVSSSDIYTVETSSTTEYEANIGDLTPQDYADWNYTAGMVVYQDRTTGFYPFQVIRYWTDPTGVAYP
ncbi:hypothetical protein [Planctomycetes bacterium Poly30]